MCAQFVLRGDALVQALAGDGRELEFDHVAPGRVFGRVIDLEAGGQRRAAAYPQAEKIVLVQDNLNTHTDAVFYQHQPTAQARAPAARFEVHYTPKNASWLNMVELELSAIARQCLHQRIPTQDELSAHVSACVAERNARRATVNWQFALDKTRTKLTRHYQKIRVTNSPD